ncbi:MAG: hypothetical protein PVF91_08245 [Chromatiales bacterium]
MSKLNRNWLIAGILTAGALVLVLGDDEEEDPKALADRSTQVSKAPQRAAPQSATAYQSPGYQAPIYAPPAPQIGRWQFRPLDSNDRAREQRQTRSTTWGDAAQPQPAAPQLPPAPQLRDGAYARAPGYPYKFRPLKSRDQEDRYTGSFPKPFDPGTLPPMMPAGPQGSGGYAVPWERGEIRRMSADNRPYR